MVLSVVMVSTVVMPGKEIRKWEKLDLYKNRLKKKQLLPGPPWSILPEHSKLVLLLRKLSVVIYWKSMLILSYINPFNIAVVP